MTVWMLSAHSDTAAVEVLDPSELAHAASLRRPRDQQTYIGLRAAMRRTLGAHLGLPPEALQFNREPCPRCGVDRHGPVRLSWPVGAGHVSWSRSGPVGLLGFDASAPLGVDIEKRSWFPDLMRTARFVLNDREYEFLVAAPVVADAFLLLWTRKEAVTKAAGTGIGIGLRSLDVLGDGVGPASVHYHGGQWRVSNPRLAPTVVTAIARPA